MTAFEDSAVKLRMIRARLDAERGPDPALALSRHVMEAHTFSPGEKVVDVTTGEEVEIVESHFVRAVFPPA